MRRADASVRLFAAIYPPPETVSSLLSALDTLTLGPRGRVPDAQVHLTVQFIGDTPLRELPEVQESVERAAAGLPAFELRPQRLMTLPAGSRPRLIAAETNGPAPLLELHRRLAHRLAKNVRERTRERFAPHLTLHRFKEPAGAVDLPLDIEPFRVPHISLMRSTLRASGAEHTEIARVPLG
jgi:RNA 2',3'-cyclic 3'-phosphodiesterase